MVKVNTSLTNSLTSFIVMNYSYSIDRNTDENRQFNVDANGLITVTGRLDREKMAVHRVHILAIDKGKTNKLKGLKNVWSVFLFHPVCCL